MKIKIVMPSEGDMELVSQEGGVIELQPIFYGSESMGPHIQILDDDGVVQSRSRLKVKDNGNVELKKGQQ